MAFVPTQPFESARTMDYGRKFGSSASTCQFDQLVIDSVRLEAFRYKWLSWRASPTAGLAKDVHQQHVHDELEGAAPLLSHVALPSVRRCCSTCPQAIGEQYLDAKGNAPAKVVPRGLSALCSSATSSFYPVLHGN
eukprot:4894900-Prymnesium_polylepis.1